MRYIKHDKHDIIRGDKDAPDGDIHFVDESGSIAIIDNTLYVNGRKADKGKKHIKLTNEDIEIDVDTKGKITGKKVTKL
jgi:hypothetical protein